MSVSRTYISASPWLIGFLGGVLILFSNLFASLGAGCGEEPSLEGAAAPGLGFGLDGKGALLLAEPTPEDPCQCMCNGLDPLSPAYACVPEWYSTGRTCDGACENPRRDTFVCGPPPGGRSAPWAPPNCTILGTNADGSRRYCCRCELGEEVA
ncbi:hypothetical protein [Chondromyces apiculatus]|uniref:Uncharacterized protein n=1 Tax=Chondromyces apiculatus DSM 436 TaxID=1192034 RepID=A0A017SYP1_9BACT|nr:hypothetical protein [Chondromyces apiculatus]EYF01902.1 Hypothetical protein CAP_7670 [Chondromyces apiculatus DSM 436]